MNELPIKINIDASAKLEVKTEIPSHASGRLVHAALDVVSPITEWLGLQGDKVRIHRAERVHVLINQAQERIALEKRPTHPIPLKIAIPLIEQASQEETDDEYMIGLWANLLASAALDSKVSPHFVHLISQLNNRQARLLLYVRRKHPRALTPTFRVQFDNELAHLSPAFNSEDFPKAAKRIESVFKEHARFIRVSLLEGESKQALIHGSSKFVNRAVDLEILKSLGLIEIVQLSYAGGLGTRQLTVEYCGLTMLGAELLELTESKRPSK